MNYANPEIITFDLDGILINSDGLHDEAFVGALTELKMDKAVATYGELRRAQSLEAVSTREKLRRIGAEDYYQQVKDLKDKLFYDLLPRVEFNQWLRYDLERNFGSLSAECRGPKLAVVTNCTESMAMKLLDMAGIAGLLPVFAATGSTQTKPHPQLYHQAGEDLGYAPGMTWLALEDSDHGIAAAQAAGVSHPVKTTFKEVKERLRLCAF